MKIGFSLPYTFLTDSKEDCRNRLLHSSLGLPKQALSFLRDRVESIELSNFSETAPTDQIIRAVHSIWSAGLEATIHGYLPESITGNDPADIYPWLDPLLREMPAHQNLLLINVHALSATRGNLKELEARTVTNLKKLASGMQSRRLPVRFALELNRSKAGVDPSITYAGVLNMCHQIDSPLVGIGWDWGHTYANVLNDLIPINPPWSFVQKVVHTHIHDIGPSGRTHWPLTRNTVPLKSYVQTLRDAGYDGYFTLELYPERFAESGPVRDLFISSINMLRDTCD